MRDYVIIVFGHTRPEALQYVLEGLRRQGALTDTQVWLDGHHLFYELQPRVEACRALEQSYPTARWYKFWSRRGLVKLFLDAFTLNAPRYRRFLFLEDDCFPAESAVQTILKSLLEIESDPRIFSVYGHHFGADDEGSETPAFQGWGWATTTEKLLPIVDDLSRLWTMPELDALAWFQQNLTPDIRARMDRYEGRGSSIFLNQLFSFDTSLAFLVAKRGMSNRKPPQQVIYNFGLSDGAGHFPVVHELLLRPPFNMITKETLIERFDLQGFPNHEEVVMRQASLRLLGNPRQQALD